MDHQKLLSPFYRQQLIEALPPKQHFHYPEGYQILKEGTQGTSCYLISEGKVQLSKKRHNGQDIPLTIMHPGEFFGEMALLSGMDRSANAITLTEVKAVQLKQEDLHRLIDEAQPLGLHLLHYFAQNLATRCGQMLQVLADSPASSSTPSSPPEKKYPPVDIRQVLDEVYSLWAI